MTILRALDKEVARFHTPPDAASSANSAVFTLGIHIVYTPLGVCAFPAP
jgi:hypothetical protein